MLGWEQFMLHYDIWPIVLIPMRMNGIQSTIRYHDNTIQAFCLNIQTMCSITSNCVDLIGHITKYRKINHEEHTIGNC